MLIVLDTNVLVSGLMYEGSVPGRVTKIAVSSARMAIDERILDEYDRVTLRPRLKINHLARELLLAQIKISALRVIAQPLNPLPKEIPDPKDLPFAEVAVAAKADALVTGNVKHFPFLKEFKVQVVSPAQFIEWAKK